MLKEILNEMNAVTGKLLQQITSTPDEHLNESPFEGSWTVAQVAEHILRSDALILKALHSKGRPAERPANANVEAIKELFLNFDLKFKSPDEIMPSNRRYDKRTLIRLLLESRRQVNVVIAGYDLTEICRNEILGEMTRMELIFFIIVHTRRHIHQLENIWEKFCAMALIRA